MILLDTNAVLWSVNGDRSLGGEARQFTEIPVTGGIAKDAGMMEGVHGDPGDRIIIATARSFDCPLLTSDRKILAYAAAGHLKAIDARV